MKRSPDAIRAAHKTMNPDARIISPHGFMWEWWDKTLEAAYAIDVAPLEDRIKELEQELLHFKRFYPSPVNEQKEVK
jgi:hypothetical protein